ncbi:Mitochondrial import inner membrane translocase subunit tim-10 isoform 1 [Melia azedarach]|uniref:Mitochondrial import inner membrane translocase subunit tim-10 isoform 1 n=1 Tax=Melia azedarach TaxID=155640 RepID=A0ACC1YR14_MELAZ|nr:Mitochondrial import inner membrane translocase subunit tim-10 isoform 1 [Melia azedarach]
MLIYVPTTPALLNRISINTFAYKTSSSKNNNSNIIIKKSTSRCCSIASKASGLFAAAIVIAAAASGAEAPLQDEGETLSNIPQELSGECAVAKDCKKPRIQRPKSRKAESCTIKCVTTCIRGGDGSPGEGPLNVRRPIVVFKEGFRSRRYCLVECSDICNLIGDGDDGP